MRMQKLSVVVAILTFSVVAYAAPQITAVNPATAAVGAQVTVSGSGFGASQGASTIAFNNVSASVVTWSDTQIVATVPTAATTGPVKATVGGVASNANVYVTVPAPQITSISPTSGVVGTQVTLTGTGFQAAKGNGSVTFNGQAASSTSTWTDTQIVATVSSFGTTGPVRVTAHNGNNSNQDVLFTMPKPTVTGVVPSRGLPGIQVQVNGTGFGATQGSSTITINGSVTPTVVSWSDTQVAITIPSSAATGFVRLTVGGVLSNSNIYFTVQLPQITGTSPSSGVVGTSVTITGSGFGATKGSSSITFNGASASTTSWSDTQIVATVPSFTSTGPLKVTTSAGASNQDVLFNMPNPTVTSLSPASGSWGTQVQVNGSGFGASQGSSTITFNSTNATVTSWSDTQITASVPASTSTGAVQVTVGGVAGNNNVYYEVPAPQITSISPTSGVVGTQVTVSGSGFGATKGSSSLSFNGVAATTSTWSDTQIVGTVAAGSTTGPARVNVGGAGNSNQDVRFTMPNPVISGMSPIAGPAGTQLQVNGSGFGATQGTNTVAIGGTTASVVSWSDTQIAATVPSGFGGSVVVTVGGVANTGPSFSLKTVAVAAVSPTAGAVGTSVTVTGTGFGSPQGSSNLYFNGTAASTISTWTNTQIVAAVPSGATSGTVKVVVSPNTSNLDVVFAVGPAVTGLSPASGGINASVTVTGSGFGSSQGTSTIYFNGTAATSISSWSSTQIVAAVPSGTTTGPVKVRVSSVDSNQNVLFTIATPTVVSLVPSSGPVGTQVQVNGTGFGATQGSSTLQFAGVNGTVVSWSDTQITATVPATAASGAVMATVSGVSGNTNVMFTVPRPQVTSISPTSGTSGTQVTITGSGFGSSGSVSFNGWNASSITSWTTTQIVASVPSSATSGPVRVTVNGVGGNQDVMFAMPNPTVSGLSPTNGLQGAQVQINGSGFGATQGTSTLTFNAVNASIVSWSDTQITATVPASATSGPVRATVGGVAGNNNVYFTIAVPQVNSASPSSGVVGTQVTVNGSGFGSSQGSSSITFNGATATPSSWSNTQIVATVPAAATTGAVRVTVNVGSNQDVLFTMPNPTVNTLSPTSGALGTQVTINGAGFGASQGSSTIAFNVQNAGVVSWSDTQIVATVPATASSGPVRVTSGGVAGNNNIYFTVPPPQISSVAPNTGGIGNSVTLAGSGFGTVSANGLILFNGAAASPSTWNSTQIVAAVPSGATTGPVQVSVNGMGSNLPHYVVPNHVISTLTPNNGPVGTQVTVAGSGFGASQGSSTLTFSGSPAASISSWSNTQIVAVVPDTAITGPAKVTLNNVPGNVDVVFTIPAPNVTAVSPGGGAVGTQVTITGTGFQANQRDSTITINGTPATVVSWSNTQIVANVATSTTTGPVLVTVNAVPGNADVIYTVPNQAIASLTPPSGPIGGTITLTGSNFGGWINPGSGEVRFNGVLAGITTWTDNSITCTVPANATSGPVTVTRWGVTSSGVNFNVAGQPNISLLYPDMGREGTSVTIFGSNFGSTQSNSQVYFNGVLAHAVTSWSDTQIMAVVSGLSGTGPVTVKVAGIESPGRRFVVMKSIEVTDSLGHVTTYASAMIGGQWVSLSTQGSGCSSCATRGTIQRAYDFAGNVLSVTDELSRTKSYTYDGAGNLTSESVPLDASTTATTTYTYNSFSQVLTATDALGKTTTNTYDTKGNLLTVTTPAPDASTPASVTQFAYNTQGLLTQITDPLNRVTTLTYTAAGLIETVTNAQSKVTKYQYDVKGNRTSVIEDFGGLGITTTFEYDSGNRLKKINYPTSPATSTQFAYDIRGRRTSVTDANGKVTTYAYDDAGRLISVTDAQTPSAGVTTYAYDTEDNLLSITDPLGRTTSFTYDAFGRVSQTAFPSSLAETYVYDAVGRMTSKTDRKGQTIGYVYDALDRLTRKNLPDSSGVDYIYDLVGKIQQVNDPTGTYGFAYDYMGRLLGTSTQYTFLPGNTYANTYTY